ncbi:MAG: VWA domain-containing protein [Vicinamibacterales bacterium]|nr:VWA domain-containing protein [Vicinamibacterales bacterium]
MSARICLVGAVVAWLVLAPGLSAQSGERHVFVSVTNTSGLPIKELGPAFFAIREDGKDREVLRAGPVSVPTHLALLVDTSGAVSSAETYRTALSAFVGNVAPGTVVAVYEFGANPIPVVPFTTDVAAAQAGIGRLAGRQDTMPRLVDAIEMACRDLKAQAAVRPVVVAVSVGGSDNSARTAGTVIKQLIELPAALHIVAVGSSAGGPASPSLTSASGRDIVARQERLRQMEAEGEGHRERSQLLADGTKKTGGTLHRVASILAIGGALERVGAELASTYQVTFSRPGGGKPKNLQVGVMLEDVVVKATAAPVATGK